MPELVVALPSFYTAVVRRLLSLEQRDIAALLGKSDTIAFFVSSQICRKHNRNTYICDFKRNALKESILYSNVRLHLRKVSTIYNLLKKNELKPRKILVVIHSELRIPLWHEEWFVALYSELLGELPSLVKEALQDNIEISRVIIEMHPGFTNLKCYVSSRASGKELLSRCRSIDAHAAIMAKAIERLDSSCPNNIKCSYTIENRSGSPTRVSIEEDGKTAVISGFSSRQPQALATFYDLMHEIRYLRDFLPNNLATRVGVTLDLPQHLQGAGLASGGVTLEWLLDTGLMEVKRITKELLKVREPLLHSVHVHWFKLGKKGGLGTHCIADDYVLKSIYLEMFRVVCHSFPSIALEPLVITPEALVGRICGSAEEVASFLRKLAILLRDAGCVAT